MQFKDAAYEILKKAGQPLHYKEIATRAMEAGLLETVGRTPEATMGAMQYEYPKYINICKHIKKLDFV